MPNRAAPVTLSGVSSRACRSFRSSLNSSGVLIAGSLASAIVAAIGRRARRKSPSGRRLVADRRRRGRRRRQARRPSASPPRRRGARAPKRPPAAARRANRAPTRSRRSPSTDRPSRRGCGGRRRIRPSPWQKSHSSSSARIIASDVRTPCPISDLATRSVIELSGSMTTKASTSPRVWPSSVLQGSPEMVEARANPGA